MRRRQGNRARLAGALLAALGAVALLALPAVAAAKDRNHDHIPDRWEKRHHLSLHVKQGGRDQDGDHLRNRDEFLAETNPRDPDTDNDGVEDGNENAGTIASFDPQTGRLVINLFNGDTVAGTVNDETEIKCGHECDGHHGDATVSDDGGDHSGPGRDGDGNQMLPPPPPGEGDNPAGDDEGNDPADGPEGPGPGPQDQQEQDASCGPEALVVGAVVEEADLKVTQDGAIFEEIELSNQQPESGS